MTDRSPEDLERYLAGELGDEERRAFEHALLQSDEAALEAYDELSVREALEQARRARSTRHRPRTRGIFPARWVAPSAVAAVLVVMAVLWQANDPEGPPVFRGAGPLTAVSPMGDLTEAPERFVWASDPNAARYRFELYDGESVSIVSQVVADTFVVIDTEAPTRGYWRVTSLDELSIPARQGKPNWYEITDR